MEAEKKYQWREGFRHPLARTNVDLVVSELKDIESVYGTLTPQLVVDSAKNKKSILHSYFNWDNDDAANRYRLKQATRLLGNVQVLVVTDDTPKILRVYETINKGGDGGASKTNPTILESFDAITTSDKDRLVRRIIYDLEGIKNRLERVERVERVEAIKHILQAILVLQTSLSEESAPVKEPPQLAVV